jgi:thiol:disulfide interchange protein
MFATVVWLVWVLGQQSGIDGAGALLALLVGLALVVWALSLGAARGAVDGLLCRSLAMALWSGAFAPQMSSNWPAGSSIQAEASTRHRLAALGARRGRPDRGHRAARCLWTSPPPGA